MLSSNVYLNTAGYQVVNGKSYKQITTIQEMPVLSEMEFIYTFLSHSQSHNWIFLTLHFKDYP